MVFLHTSTPIHPSIHPYVGTHRLEKHATAPPQQQQTEDLTRAWKAYLSRCRHRDPRAFTSFTVEAARRRLARAMAAAAAGAGGEGEGAWVVWVVEAAVLEVAAGYEVGGWVGRRVFLFGCLCVYVFIYLLIESLRMYVCVYVCMSRGAPP